MLHSLSKVVRLLVPFSAGSGSDTIGRIYTKAGTLPQVKQGRLRPLAVTSSKRLTLMPELPTIAESGIANLAKFESGNCYGIVVPAKTPREIIDRAHKASVASLHNPAISKRLNDLGFLLIGNTSEEFGAYFRAEIEAWGKIVRDLKLSAD